MNQSVEHIIKELIVKGLTINLRLKPSRIQKLTVK